MVRGVFRKRQSSNLGIQGDPKMRSDFSQDESFASY